MRELGPDHQHAPFGDGRPEAYTTSHHAANSEGAPAARKARSKHLNVHQAMRAALDGLLHHSLGTSVDGA
jgi:hypothetical protein